MDIRYINRETGKIEIEKVAGEKYLKWIYQNPLGRSFLEIFFKKKIFSFFYGKLQDLSISKKKINSFIQEFNIDMRDFAKELDEYRSFNDFFTRKLEKDARKIDITPEHIISPADGKILVYQNINKKKLIQIKGLIYTLEDLLQDKCLANQYDGGACAVIRLCPSDYHRFHFPDAGIPHKAKRVKGDLYSVNPLALRQIKKIYCRNERQITILNSENFDDILFIEVGATCVGSIIQTYRIGEGVVKGQEKGYFKFGGSTVILFFKANKIFWDRDLLENTRNSLETQVKMGMRIGEKILK